MTRFLDRERARTLRKRGKSYSEIKQILKVGKGTLSAWLRDMPLSALQMRAIRDLNPKRIEKFRATMRHKREVRMLQAYERAVKDIGTLSKRDLFIAGLYLYWGEGTKAHRGNTIMTNTDPAVIRAFLDWANLIGLPKERMYVRLHLYADMNAKKEVRFWSKELDMSLKQFRNPHMKRSLLSNLTYKTGFGHGTCDIRFENIATWEYITMALKRLRELHIRP